MPSQTFALRRGEPKRLKVTYENDPSNLRVYFSDVLIGGVDNKDSLKAGVAFNLPDGSVVGLSSSPGWKFQVSINGRPLRPDILDPVRQINTSATWVAVVGVLYFFTGLILKRGDVYGDADKTISVVLGTLFIVCAYFVVTKRLKLALGIPVGIYGMETILLIVSMLSKNGISWWPLLVHVVFLGAMSQGFKAIDNANNDDYLATASLTTPATSQFSSVPQTGGSNSVEETE